MICSSLSTTPCLLLKVLYTPCTAWIGVCISHRKMGSYNLGLAVNMLANRQRLAVLIIWPPPRWMESGCRVTSSKLNLTFLRFSPQRTPSLVAHWKAVLQWSFISCKYWTCLVCSTNTFAPVFSGPKHQIFFPTERSQPQFSLSFLALTLTSILAFTSAFSMASASPSSRGYAVMYNLLNLFGLLLMHNTLLVSLTVSL